MPRSDPGIVIWFPHRLRVRYTTRIRKILITKRKIVVHCEMSTFWSPVENRLLTASTYSSQGPVARVHDVSTAESRRNGNKRVSPVGAVRATASVQRKQALSKIPDEMVIIQSPAKSRLFKAIQSWQVDVGQATIFFRHNIIPSRQTSVTQFRDRMNIRWAGTLNLKARSSKAAKSSLRDIWITVDDDKQLVTARNLLW